MTLRLALFEPDIPQNTGTMIRLGACFRVPIDIIEPCGFVFSDKALKRAGMDYIDQATIQSHPSWRAFEKTLRDGETRRLVLLTTQASSPYCDFRFSKGDTLLVGRESAGVPQDVHARAEARVRIPMAAGTRSLNVAVAASIVLAEALRQTNGFPASSSSP